MEEMDFSLPESSALEAFKADVDTLLDTLTTLVRKILRQTMVWK